jgi:hypothetical protein
VTVVGGTWTDVGVGLGSGGTSLVWGQPAYQKGVVPASMSRVRVGKRIVTDRAVPDIAADGDVDSGFLTGYIASGTDADAQQGQKSAFGFIDPLIYRLAGTPAFHDILPVTASMPQQDRDAWEPASAGASPAVDVFDSQERAYTQQVTAKGYDTMTGVGTPNGPAFIPGCAAPPTVPIKPLATTGPFGEIKFFLPGPVTSPPGERSFSERGEPGRRGRRPSAA